MWLIHGIYGGCGGPCSCFYFAYYAKIRHLPFTMPCRHSHITAHAACSRLPLFSIKSMGSTFGSAPWGQMRFPNFLFKANHVNRCDHHLRQSRARIRELTDDSFLRSWSQYNLLSLRVHSRTLEPKHKCGLAVHPSDLLCMATITPTKAFAAH